MKIQLATPERIVFEGQADNVSVQAEKGQLNILDRHTDLVSFVRPGPLVLKQGSETLQKFQLGNGVLKVEKGRLTILSPQVEALTA